MKTRHLLSVAAAVAIISPAMAVSPEEKERTLDYLYSVMPLPDSLNYSRSFWEKNVETSLEARETMPWGHKVPDREWRHFVLPVRVNNEELDSSRMVFYHELRDRVKGLTMTEAALEVNHWLHEKASYRPSDPRTSPALATVRTGWGRCGEESTLGVAAMRSVGIPARQVYTPRWAHTDDNHAWVEVWVDGAWHFLGACEPEPVLDLAWFNSPASRGMMMATNVAGKYDGPEQQLYSDSCFTRINVTANYAPVRRATVRVVDAEGRPVAGAPVGFRLYNYAEFYPLLQTVTDADGQAWVECGYGDILAWANTPGNGAYGYTLLKSDADNPVTLKLDSPMGSFDLDVVPPAPSGSAPAPSQAMIDENNRRKAYEDSLRAVRSATFFNPETAREFVNRTFATADSADRKSLETLLVESYGNHSAITAFLTANSDRPREIVDFFSKLQAKDWRDISPAVLDACFRQGRIVDPRVEWETLTPFPVQFDSIFGEDVRQRWNSNPEEIRRWIESNIRIDNSRNPNFYPIYPATAVKAGVADSHSRELLYVALCRWAGIPAAIDEVTGQTQSAGDDASAKALFRLTYPETGTVPDDPKYFVHFTLSSIGKDGRPHLLNYPEEATWRSMFKEGVNLAPGRYMLTTGRRLASGSVNAHVEIFDIAGADTITMPLTLRHDPSAAEIIGSVNADPLLPLTGRGFFVAAAVAPDHEPSSHFLNELAASAKQFEAWGRPIVLLFSTPEEAARFNPAKHPGLPSTVVVATDASLTRPFLEELNGQFHFAQGDNLNTGLPVVVVADSFNRVVQISTGYSVGSVDRIANILPMLPE